MIKKIFGFFLKKDKSTKEKNTIVVTAAMNSDQSFDDDIKAMISRRPEWAESDNNDYLGMAVKARDKLYEAMENGQFDLAWKYGHERLSHYHKHAEKSGFTTEQTLGLLSIVYSELSSVLMEEGKHAEAIGLYLYSLHLDGKKNEGTYKNIRKFCRQGDLVGIQTKIIDYIDSNINPSQREKADIRKCKEIVLDWISSTPFSSKDNNKMIKHYYNSKGYVYLVNGVSPKIQESLENRGVETIQALAKLSDDELLEVKGIGNSVLAKIRSSLNEAKQ